MQSTKICNRCKAKVPRLYKSRDYYTSRERQAGSKRESPEGYFELCYRCYKLRAKIKQASILIEHSNWYASSLKELSEDEQQRYSRIAKRKR